MGRVTRTNSQSPSNMSEEIQTPNDGSQAPSGRVHPLVRAYRVEVKDWPDATSIVRTVSRARAKYLAWNSAKEAGYNLSFSKISAKRAPKHDLAASLITDRCYGIDHAEDRFM